MREIWFRGKRIDNFEWIDGYFVNIARKNPFIFTGKIDLNECIGGHLSPEMHAVFAESVGQFTGLTDKNGKNIFEGDIIRYSDLYDYNCYLESLNNTEAYDNIDFGDLWTISNVVYGINMGYPAFDLNKHNFESNALSELSESGDFYYEVIGNIYDNPELLEFEVE